ncbi:MAG: glycosyltransferase [Muribaculaceae bacterium]|nr:glycosyltransferase [Muribaculaceae bacterium]
MLPHTLILITSAFPADTLTEPTFIMPELRALSKRFRKIVVMPMLDPGSLPRVDLSELGNVEVSTALCRYPLLRHKWLRLMLLSHPAVLRSLLTGKVDEITYAASAVAVCMRLKSLGFDSCRTLLYSYWFDSQGVGAVMTGMPTIIRAHGYDVWTSRGGRLRADALRGAVKLFAVSEAGAEHIRQQYPCGAANVAVARLGSVKLFPGRISLGHKVQDRKLTFLTCARAVEVKRVDMIYRFVRAIAIARPATAVKWIYIGDGPLMYRLRDMIAEDDTLPNFEAEFAGAISNRKVQERYLSEPVDWNIMLSSSEGLPIALCEALSYGVPVIATDVGGIAELIDDSCGILLPENPEKEEFVRGIAPYLDSDYRSGELRKGAFVRWQTVADAQRLSEEFAARIADELNECENG